MKQLTGLDASFLYMETGRAFGHVNGLGIYRKPDDPTYQPYEALKSQIESRLHMLEPFRRRLVQVPLGLDHPYWINDPDFDIEFHVRHIAIPPPGDQTQLGAQVARIIGRPMDRTRPLWEAYVMEGLADDQFAILTKFHHATVDGAAGVEMLTMLLDSDPAGDELPPDDGRWKPEAIPSDLELLGKTAISYLQRPYRLARFQLNAVQQVAELSRSRGLQSVVSAARSQLPGPLRGTANDRELPNMPSVRAPHTPFNGPLTPHRRLAIRSVSLAEIKALKDAAGATVNDIVMTVCAGALRNYLIEHDALPDQPLQAMVPVSIRTGEEADKWTNRVSALVVTLPTNEPDRLARLASMQESMNVAKDQFELVPAETIVDAVEFSSPALAAQAARLAGSLNFVRSNMPVNVVISNVPGPRRSLYVAGAEMQNYYPVSTVAEGIGLNITVHSYKDDLDFGLVSCRELVPDLEDLIDLHLAEIDGLFADLKVDRPGQSSAKAEEAGTSKTSSKKKPAARKQAPKKKATPKKRAAKKTPAS